MMPPAQFEHSHVYINALDNEDKPYLIIVRLKGDAFEIWHDEILLAQGQRHEMRSWLRFPILAVVADDITLDLNPGIYRKYGPECGRHSISTPDIKDWPLNLEEVGHLQHVV